MKAKSFLINPEETLQKISSQKIILSIILLSLLIFSPVFTGSEFLTYDDNWYIYENENVINLSWKSIVNIFTTLQGGQYSPLGEVYHSILYYLFGKNATAFKICALLVHLVNAALLFKIFDVLFKNRLLVIIVVLFFAIHPLQVETIGWISVIFRNAVFFMFLGYLFYIRYLDTFKKYNLIPVLVCYILAFLTKEQAILFPVGLFLIQMMRFQDFWNKRFIIEMIFWAVVALIFGLITIEVTKTGGPSIVNRTVSVYDKIALLSKTILAYTTNFLFPFKLSFSYPYPVGKSNISFLTICFAFGLLILGSFISFKDKIFRFGFLWILGFLSLGLVFSFFHLRDSFMADRYAYLAIIGYSLLLYWVLSLLKKFFSNNLIFLGVLSFFVVSYAIVSFKRIPVFKNSKNLWTQAIEVNPENQYAYNSLGFYYRNHNKIDTAFVYYKKALKIDPNYYLAHSNIGKVYYNKKQYDSALYHVSKAITINPLYKRAYLNRAAIYSKTNKRDLYLQDLNKILNLEPGKIKYLKERARTYFELKQYDNAVKDATELIKLNPNDSFSYYLIGHSYLLQKSYEKANQYMDKAIQKNSKEGKYFFIRSLCRFRVGKTLDALNDAIMAKKAGFNVNESYLMGLIQEVKKSKNKKN